MNDVFSEWVESFSELLSKSSIPVEAVAAFFGVLLIALITFTVRHRSSESWGYPTFPSPHWGHELLWWNRPQQLAIPPSTPAGSGEVGGNPAEFVPWYADGLKTLQNSTNAAIRQRGKTLEPLLPMLDQVKEADLHRIQHIYWPHLMALVSSYKQTTTISGRKELESATLRVMDIVEQAIVALLERKDESLVLSARAEADAISRMASMKGDVPPKDASLIIRRNTHAPS